MDTLPSGDGAASIAAPASRPSPETRILRDIHPPGRWSPVSLGDIWQSRELLYFLSLRDIKIRYKQAIFGAGWAVLQPLFMMIVFWVFLGKLANISSNLPGVPYSVLAFSGLVPWLFFANGVTVAAESMVTNSNLISKVYFPRLIVPFASVASWLPDLVIGLLVLLGLMAINGLGPGPAVLLVPAFILLAVMVALAASVWLSALNVAYRDIHYVAPFFLQLGLFLTPVTYPPTLIHSSRLRLLQGLNPMTGVVDGFRWAVVGHGPAPWGVIAESIAVAGTIFVAGLLYFRRTEQFFADVI